MEHFENIVVFGANGAIGHALLDQLSQDYPDASIHGFSRDISYEAPAKVITHQIDYADDAQMGAAIKQAASDKPIDLAIITIGTLHGADYRPEGAAKKITRENMRHLYEVNTVIPSLIVKYLMAYIPRRKRAVLAFLSARVGSISDNYLGGWYSYRASKAALNMVVKCLSVEVARSRPQAIVVSLHPGTVNSALSAPFQSNVPPGKLFTPDYAAECLLTVIDALSPKDSGKHFAWDGSEIAP